METSILREYLDEAFNIRRGKTRRQPAPELIALPVFAPEAQTSKTRDIYPILDQIVITNLERCRSQFSLPPLADWTKAFQADFGKGDQELRSWSALYTNYCCRASFSYNKKQLAQLINTAPQVLRRWVLGGLDRLADELNKRSGRTPAQTADWDELQPPEFSRLLGSEKYVENILNWLSQPDCPLIIGLQGLGGIGKTALAYAALQQVKQQGNFPRQIWVSARQDRYDTHSGRILSAEAAHTIEDVIARIANGLGEYQLAGHGLKEKVKILGKKTRKEKCLIVIDNLETLEETNSLLPLIYPMAGSTRFLLTSREDFGQFPYVQALPIEALNRSESIALIKQEIGRLNPNLELTDIELDQIFALVGGIPLALKLVSAQACSFPVQEVLHNLEHATESAPQNLLNYIYRKTWQSLSEEARLFLVQTQRWLAAEGATLDWLHLQVKLSDTEIHAAIIELESKSLLELRRKDQEWRYCVHNLTRTFLNTDLLNSMGQMHLE